MRLWLEDRQAYQEWRVGPYIHGETRHDRIVACVNACAGIPTEQLEAGCVGKLLGVARGVVHACSSPMGTAYELPRLLSEAGDALAPFQKDPNQ
jgi:hypothetical protein